VLERILCPVDFSETSQHAIDHALALATWYGAQITALHAYDETGANNEVERLRVDVAAEFRQRGANPAPVDIRVQAQGREGDVASLSSFISSLGRSQ